MLCIFPAGKNAVPASERCDVIDLPHTIQKSRCYFAGTFQLGCDFWMLSKIIQRQHCCEKALIRINLNPESGDVARGIR
jgi:hypothetical protein